MKFIALFAIFAAVYAQEAGFQDLLTIDNFNVETPAIVVLIPPGASFPITDEKFTAGTDAEIIGAERDLQLTVLSGDPNSAIVSGVAQGAFSISSPSSVTSESLIQWDGVDGSMNLASGGLGSRDLTSGGLATGFRTSIEAETTTTVEFRIYNNGNLCNTFQQVPGTVQQVADYIIPFSEFSGDCDFSDVGAIEINISNDVFLDLFTTYGPIPAVFSQPPASILWSLYFPACIEWNASLFSPGETVSFTLQTGTLFDSEILFVSDVLVDSGSFNWAAIYGILPSPSARVKAVFGAREPIYSDIFGVTLPDEGYDNTCSIVSV